MKYFRKPLYLLLVISILTGMLSLQPPEPVRAASPEDAVRISQAYGGGGNSGALYKNDFIELFNASDSPVDLTGWSVQYASVTGSAWSKTNLIGTIPANSYYLIQQSQGSGGTLELPDPDAGGTIAMQGQNFKVALTKATTVLSGACPTEDIIVDFVGVGPNANCYEGEAPTSVLTNASSALRLGDGCQDTDQNVDDFIVSDPPTPRNTASDTHSCSVAPTVFPERFIISEYVEGSSSNKAIELYNGTGADLDLGDYKLTLHTNGNPVAINPKTWDADTILENGDTYILVNSAADAALLALADETHTVTYYNGDDALVLWHLTPDGDVVQDSFGQVGVDPGNAWGSGDTSTLDRTLVRKAEVCQGDLIPDDAFEPSLEYIGFARDTFSNLGSHTMTCGAPVDNPPSISTTVPANGATDVGLTFDIKITFSEPVSLSEDWYSISCGVSGTHTATVSDANPIFTLNPEVDFSTNETCTVTIDADKVLDQDETPDAMAADYTFIFATAEGCGGPTTGIYDIQGEGMATSMSGQTVTVEGVVVGDYQVGGRNGFFIQEVVGDNNSATSDGIFIYAPGIADADVNLGDELRVRGSVSEYYEQTQITNSAWQLCSSGNTIEPTVITLPVTAQTDFEKYEGMLVKFEQPLIVSEYFNFDRYGEIVLTTERFVTGTAKYEPGSDEYYDEIERFNLNKITLDDGRSQQNQHPAYHPNGEEFTLTNLFRGGGTVTNLVGVMDYYSSTYRLQPVFIGEYEETNPRTAEPELQEGDLTIASFNVLNYFVTLDGSGNRCGPTGGMECRGADTTAELTRQRAKILAAMNIIDADIFGLMEIENDGPTGNNAVADLVAGLNDLKGEGTYAYIQTGSIGTDAIKQAILYKPASVTPVGAYVTLTEAIDTRFDTSKNRPSLAQAFEDNASDVEFVVSVNHLKSKGSACDGDPDLGDGAGNCNMARTEAAQALADWLVPANWDGIDKFLIIGDLNAYDKETPIDAIKAGADDEEGTPDDFVDTILKHQGDDAYGYVFDGMVGYLDHALASPAMDEIVLDTNFWHINADEADVIDYDMTFKPAAQAALLYAPDAYRSSDHDPVIVSLKTIPDNNAPVAEDQSDTTNEDLAKEITLVATDADGDTLTFAIVDEPQHGGLSLVSGNTVTYTPDANYFGTDSFTFKANDGDLDSNTATVSISITSVEDLPIAQDQDVSLNEDTSKEITLIASDGDGDPLTYAIVAPPQHGSLSVVSGDKVTYTPNANYFGDDSFTFKANDTKADSNTATVSITVLPVNDAPVAEDQNVSTDKNTSIEITLVASDIDGDALTYSIRQNVSHGSLSIVNGNKVTYTPNANFSGMDSFTFRANDGSLNSNTATVIIMVNFANEAPVAQVQTVETDEDTAKEITLFASDDDGDPLTYAIVAQPQHGSLSLLSGNKLTYTPDENYNGPDSFTFKANDGTLDSNIAEVTINVKPVNDAPVAYDQSVIAVAGETIEIELEALDIDGDILEFIIVEEPLHGTFELEGNILKYTPSATYGGVDSFTFKANDGSLDSNIATVTITVIRTQYSIFLPFISR